MDITRYIEYLSQEERIQCSPDSLCMDPVFIEWIHMMHRYNTVTIHGSYFYKDYSEDEFYSFEGKEELLDGLLQLSHGEHHTKLVLFVETLDRACCLYELIYGISIL